MNIVLLSGDSGKRLWPLSNGVRSKQFIKCLKKDDGTYESMLQRIHRQIGNVLPDSQIFVMTSRPQVSAVVNQLGENIGICAEPFHKDNFASVCMAASWLRDVCGVSNEDIVAFCPADTFVLPEYYGLLEQMEQRVKSGECMLAMTAVPPTYPSEKYGYVLTHKQDNCDYLKEYILRPKETEAEKLIQNNALWSASVFVGKLDFFLKTVMEYISFEDHEELYGRFENIPKLDWEQILIKKAERTAVFEYHGDWKTLGTWNTLTEAMEDTNVGNALFDEHCRNVHVVNELDVPVLCMGLSNLVVSASAEGILVSDKTHSSYITPYVDRIDQRIMFADKSWGSYRVLDVEDESMTIKVTLNPGHSMNYHSHERRDEVWTVISGEGITIVDGMEQPVRAGDVITMEAGCRHTIIAKTKLNLIEVQLGLEISVQDKKKYELEI